MNSNTILSRFFRFDHGSGLGGGGGGGGRDLHEAHEDPDPSGADTGFQECVLGHTRDVFPLKFIKFGGSPKKTPPPLGSPPGP